MKLRRGLGLLLAALSALASGLPAHARSVASKVAEFKDQYCVSALAFNVDGTQLAVNFMVAGDGHALAYSPDGSLLAVRYDITHDRGVMRIWSAGTDRAVKDIAVPDEPGYTRGFAFSPDGTLLYRVTNQNIYTPGDHFIAQRTDSWERVWSVRTIPYLPTVVAISPDGQLAALGGLGHPQIFIIDLTTHQILRTIAGAPSNEDEVESVAWSPDGSQVAIGYGVDDSLRADAVKVFDPITGTQVAALRADSATVTGLNFSPNDKYLIAGSVDNSVRILDGHDFSLRQRISGDARSIAISRDSRYLAIGNVRNVSVWELK